MESLSKFMWSNSVASIEAFLLLGVIWSGYFIYSTAQRSPKNKFIARNFAYILSIIIGITLAIILVKSWFLWRTELFSIAQYIIWTFIASLLSGIFTIGLYLAYLLEPEKSIILRPDIQDSLKQNHIQLLRSEILLAESRISEINSFISHIDRAKNPGILPEEVKDGELNHEFKLITGSVPPSSSYNSLYKFTIKKGISLMYIQENILIRGSRGTRYSLYISSKGSTLRLYDSNQNNMNYDLNLKIEDAFVNGPATPKIKSLLQEISSIENSYKRQLKDDLSTQRFLPIGMIWYYVFMLIFGTKVDYFIPSNSLAKTIVLLLAISRYFLFGSFLAIMLNHNG